MKKYKERKGKADTPLPTNKLCHHIEKSFVILMSRPIKYIIFGNCEHH